MTNLLTNDTQQAHKHRYVARLLYASAATMLLASLVVALAFLPGYIKARTAWSVAQIGVDIAAQRGKSDREALISARKRIAALEEVFTRTRPVDVVAEILEQAPSGVSVTALNYVARNDGATLSVVGTVPQRQAVQEYIARLRNTGSFRSVDVPLNSLSRGQSNSFEIRIEIPLPI